MLGRLVDAHPEIAVVHEARFVPGWFVHRRGVTADGFATPELVERLVEFERFEHLGVAREHLERLIATGEPVPYATFVSELFDLHGRARGKRLVGGQVAALRAQHPDAARALPGREGRPPRARRPRRRALRRELEEGHGARRPRRALRDLAGGSRSSTIALWWEREVRLGREDGRALGPDLYDETRYEALVADPAGECARLCAFLGVAVRRRDARVDRRAAADARPARLADADAGPRTSGASRRRRATCWTSWATRARSRTPARRRSSTRRACARCSARSSARARSGSRGAGRGACRHEPVRVHRRLPAVGDDAAQARGRRPPGDRDHARDPLDHEAAQTARTRRPSTAPVDAGAARRGCSPTSASPRLRLDPAALERLRRRRPAGLLRGVGHRRLRPLRQRRRASRSSATRRRATCAHIPVLHELFPHARFVHLIRDGRDVCSSVLDWERKAATRSRSSRPGRRTASRRRPSGGSSACAPGARPARRSGPASTTSCATRRSSPIRRATCRALCDFLELPYSERMVASTRATSSDDAGLSAKRAWRPITPGLRSWRTEMSARGRASASRPWPGALLDELGYHARGARPEPGSRRARGACARRSCATSTGGVAAGGDEPVRLRRRLPALGHDAARPPARRPSRAGDHPRGAVRRRVVRAPARPSRRTAP